MQQADLCEKGSFILSKFNNELIRDNSYMGALLFAPTATGKGVAHIIPELLSWDNSLIIHDIKGENFDLTSGYREKVLKQKIFLYNPLANSNTHSYNPLNKVFDNQTDIINEINQILKVLLPNNDVSTNEAKYLITSIILYLNITKEHKKTLGEIFRILQKEDLEYFLDTIVKNNKEKINTLAITYINGFLKKSENDKQIIKNIALNSLSLWSNPNIDKNTEKSDFNASNFTDEKSSLYLVVLPGDITQLKQLLIIIYTQLISSLTAIKIKDMNKQNGTLLILDEFPTLGKLDIITDVITYARGYKLKLLLVIQNIDQLTNVYGQDAVNTIVCNCPIKICFGTNNENTANLISNLLGKQIIVNEDNSKVVEPLFIPQEIMQLPKDEEIIIINDLNIKANKIFYYKDFDFAERLMGPAKIK